MIRLTMIGYGDPADWYVDSAAIVSVVRSPGEGNATHVMLANGRDAHGSVGATLVQEAPAYVVEKIREARQRTLRGSRC